MQIFGFCLVVSLLAGAYGFVGFCDVKDISCCHVRIQCLTTGPGVWTTSDNQTCNVFPNKCILHSKNCQQLRANQPKYVEIPKEECQAMCSGMMCMAIYDPICGSNNGILKTFGSSCSMQSHICSTGDYYNVVSEGACPSSSEDDDSLDSSLDIY